MAGGPHLLQVLMQFSLALNVPHVPFATRAKHLVRECLSSQTNKKLEKSSNIIHLVQRNKFGSTLSAQLDCEYPFLYIKKVLTNSAVSTKFWT